MSPRRTESGEIAVANAAASTLPGAPLLEPGKDRGGFVLYHGQIHLVGILVPVMHLGF